MWEEDSKIVGNITVNRTGIGSRRWLISNLAVAKQYRGRGIARGLLETGLELVKCFATSRDVTEELPADLQGREWRPLDPRFLGEELSDSFRNLPDTAVTEASLAITVTPE